MNPDRTIHPSQLEPPQFFLFHWEYDVIPGLDMIAVAETAEKARELIRQKYPHSRVDWLEAFDAEDRAKYEEILQKEPDAVLPLSQAALILDKK